MTLRGREVKAKLIELRRRHHVAPITRAPIALLQPTSKPQIIQGWATTQDVDSERTVFMRGSLSWPDDLGKLPLLLKHDSRKVCGKILDLHDVDGRWFLRARVDDPLACRMGGLSICATILEATLHDEGSVCFHFTVERAVIDEISIVNLPSNPQAIITHRRDVGPVDTSSDAVLVAVRARRTLEELRKAWSARPEVAAKAAPVPRYTHDIQAASALILGNIPVR